MAENELMACLLGLLILAIPFEVAWGEGPYYKIYPKDFDPSPTVVYFIGRDYDHSEPCGENIDWCRDLAAALNDSHRKREMDACMDKGCTVIPDGCYCPKDSK